MTKKAPLKSQHFSPELLTDSTMSFEERRPLILEAAKAFLTEHREAILAEHRLGAPGWKVVGELTSLIDTLLRNLYRSVTADEAGPQAGSCAIIAIGGYGRGELNPCSDIDIMFYYSGKDMDYAKDISEKMLYLLWDLGLDVGHSVRTEQDCLEMISRDITARTALLDSRFLAGDSELYSSYGDAVYNVALGENTRHFIKEKVAENEGRLRKYGSSVYLLEPNIKEGEGGLRDIHTALWMARVKFKARSLRELVIKGVLTEPESKEIEDALDYLWRIRNELHFSQTRKKNDQLHFDQQEELAKFFGYRDNKKALAVEQFMQDYYAHATAVEHMASGLISKVVHQDEPSGKILGFFTRRTVEPGFYILRGELRATDKDIFQTDPASIMRAFMLSQRHGVALSIPLKGLMRDSLELINDKVRRSRKMSEAFREILRNPQGLVETLRDMNHLQVLNRFIPEFGRIFCKVQHDAYHIYTVDTHSLFAVEVIAKLWLGEYAETEPLLTKVAGDIEKPALLLLAVLLHDIGKGEGKDHCNKGADMIPTIARRLGLNKEDSRRLEFLVRNHLEMSHIAQRRDLHDDKLILQFARSMGMSENLNMLYLLTFADLKAVGPDVWSQWKGFLLRELYEKTYQVLERGNFQLEKRSEKVRNRKRKVVELLEDEYGKRGVQEALKGVSTRYVLSYRSATIAEHLQIMLSRKNSSLATRVEHYPEAKYSQVTISTLDIPGLFSKVTGVMAANGINILGAQIHTFKTGVALDVLQVSSATGEIIDNPEKWKNVEDNLLEVIQGRVRVDELVDKRQRSSLLPARALPQFANRVEVNNEVSDEHTVLDIYTRDQVGVLYQITKALKEMGLYIGVAKISTKVDQVADTFYVQDIFGQKVVQEEKIEELRNGLLESLNSLS